MISEELKKALYELEMTVRENNGQSRISFEEWIDYHKKLVDDFLKTKNYETTDGLQEIDMDRLKDIFEK